MMQRMKGTLRPGRKAGVLALAVLLLTCVLMAGAVSATITVTSDNFAEKIAGANSGDVLTLEPGEYNLPNGLKIEKAITLTAAEANNKPNLTVSLDLLPGSMPVGIWVAAAGVKLDNLSITSTGGSGNQNAVIYVQIPSGTDPVEITSSEITTTLTETSAVRGIEISTQCPAPVNIIGNTFRNDDESAQNQMGAIYSNPRSGIQDVINYNIFDGTYAALVGYDPGEGSIAPDVRYNYWGPTIPDDAFPETITEYVPYYTALNDDGTIKTDSLTYAASITRDGETTYYGSIPDALNAAVDGDTIKIAAGEYELTSALTINKGVTITANDPAAKPTLTVPQVFIAAPGVTLDNLKIQQTADTDSDLYTVRVTSAVTEGQITITDSEILPVNNGRGFAINAGAQFDLIFTGNTVKAANEGDQLAFAIYIEAYNKGFVFEKNIIPMCSKAQLGVDLRVNEVSMDISKNYWGEAGPNLELHVDDGQTLNLAGQNVYYTQLNDDGMIDEGSLHTPGIILVSGGSTTYFDTIEGALNAAVDGDTIKIAAGEYELTRVLTINKGVTITANDPAAKPTIKVPRVEVRSNTGVTLESLNIVQTGISSDRVLKFVGGTGDMAVKNCVITALDGGSGVAFSSQGDITFTGNTLTADGDLRYGFYMNSYEGASYTFEENIISACTKAQFGVDQKDKTLSTPVDISKNYWGGSEPTFERFVVEGGTPALAGQGTYYTKLNLDGTIDKNSIYPPVEPTPQPPTPVPPSYSSGSGNMDNAYRVLFNDGSTTLSVVTDLSSGDKLTKPATPVKDGYTFAGWYKDSACTQGWDFETGIPGDMTLYAKWTAAGSSGETEATTAPTATSTAVTTPQPTKTQTAAATTSAPEATTAAGVSPTLTQAPAPVAGALFGLLAAGVLLRRRFQ